MKKFLLSFSNDLMVAVAFGTATITSQCNWIIGSAVFIVAYILLDFHSYNDKKFGYPNNLFIH